MIRFPVSGFQFSVFSFQFSVFSSPEEQTDKTSKGKFKARH